MESEYTAKLLPIGSLTGGLSRVGGMAALSNTTATTNFGTSTKTITIPTGSLTWSQIKNYGSNFTIMVYVRRSSRNTTGYFYCYGAEIEVTYTI